MHRPGVEPGISRSQAQRRNHYTNRATRIRSQLATVSTSLNKFADSEVELRRVGGVNARVGSRES